MNLMGTDNFSKKTFGTTVTAGSPGFVYYNSLEQDHPNYFRSVKRAMDQYQSSHKQDYLPKAVSILRLMASQEREKEISLIVKYFGAFSSNNLADTNTLIRTITKIFQFDDILKRVIIRNDRRMNTSGNAYKDIDMWANFIEYFAEAVEEIATNPKKVNLNNYLEEDWPTFFDAIKNDAFDLTLKKLNFASIYQSKDTDFYKKGDKDQSGAFTEMYNFLTAPGNQMFYDLFKKEVLEAYSRGVDPILQRMLRALKNGTKLNAEEAGIITTYSRDTVGGSIKESVDRVALSNVGEAFKKAFPNAQFIVERPGFEAENRSDEVVMVGVSFSVNRQSYISQLINAPTSDRAEGIQNYEKIARMMEQLTEEDFIVHFNAKNYAADTISSTGFSAGSAMKLKDYYTLLSKGQNPKDAAAFVTALMNTLQPLTENMSYDGSSGNYADNGAVNKDFDDSLVDQIATDIGYFLFDDPSTIGKNAKGGKSVHIMSLDGYYYPLSAFLYLMADAIYEIFKKGSVNHKGISDIFKAEIHPGRVSETPYGDGSKMWTRNQWERQRDRALDGDVKIAAHFLKNFLDLMWEVFQNEVVL